MYSYTPTSKFLVLAPTESAPLSTSTPVPASSTWASTLATLLPSKPPGSKNKFNSTNRAGHDFLASHLIV
ncbi:hypothetical protein ASPBRDRAFT_193033 [Aspergillus brasiliensis CBS 101740]|uniref:Uncharacterized protein n=1 Tax=Aspergillus brasiliensis (strain CBS 101740 / IMI 381727 / IBT 21946) TaxID=767769 RepID=A0A1L9URB4_ASPBC|nr:hypothetical protein ASPBRDRAFT_193033 [Aspergillus brasiliensis CBS 101740]